jgi:triosephosphate isomerase
VIRTQIQGALHDIDYPDPERLIIAYEPVWAIGSGTPASPADAQQVHQFIRLMLADLGGSAWGDGVRILYGGSAKPENISDFLRMEDIDGALVGGASLDPASFLSMIGKAAEGRL